MSHLPWPRPANITSASADKPHLGLVYKQLKPVDSRARQEGEIWQTKTTHFPLDSLKDVRGNMSEPPGALSVPLLVCNTEEEIPVDTDKMSPRV